MKRFIYSTYTKFAALVLIALCVAFGVNVVFDTISRYNNEEVHLYGFEEDFEHARYFSAILNDPSAHVYNVYSAAYHAEEDIDIGDSLRDTLKYLDTSEELNYFISINGEVFTNCGAESEEDITKDKYFILNKRYPNGDTHYDAGIENLYNNGYMSAIYEYNSTDEIVVAASVKDTFATKSEDIWTRQAKYIEDAFVTVVILCAVALLLLVYLIAAAGKRADDEVKPMWLDSIWTEIHLACMGASAVGAAGAVYVMIEMYLYNQLPLYMVKTIVIFAVVACLMIAVTSLLSIVRKLKCRMFVKTSVICIVLMWAWRVFKSVVKYIIKKLKNLRSVILLSTSKRTVLIEITVLFVYTAVIGFCGILTPESPMAFLFAVVVFGYAGFKLLKRAQEVEEIKQGADEIRKGNLSYKIPEVKSEDLKALATNINEIGMGLDESVSAKMKAEKMKTELITNVSHDLKTPLTSIISYTELLSNVENLPEEAKDYVKIIAKKSDRLKNLTQDLFDISKVQSGSEIINFEKLDVKLLINQSLGEHDSEIKKSELAFCVDMEKDLYILADGRKMSRVIGNLISNALKYSMKNTRVFISAMEKDGEIVLEFKNIASYPMKFDAEEIIGRFVRGDEARTSEGSGLGLAIAKSYTEACTGTFSIVTDGDLFKAIIKFKKY